MAFDDVDYATTAANTGDHETLIVERDVTSYFVTNFGAGTQVLFTIRDNDGNTRVVAQAPLVINNNDPLGTT